MVDWIKRIVKKVSDAGGFFMFLRAQFSSQIASLTDFAITILLHKLFNLYYVYATFIGALGGGIINCAINYKWTFKANTVKKRYVAIKYVLVWVGSIFLNTYGTYLSTELLSTSVFLRELLGHLFDDVFIVCKLIVSLLVGFLWNYNMHRLFVYRDRNISKFFRVKNKKQSVK
ncbi:GtrA family protein [Bacteroidales bacterium OttesenSCG-928-M06]|nr:GtrA family protein [Bacteroidales bacterium OttesenSCG-928-M06]